MVNGRNYSIDDMISFASDDNFLTVSTNFVTQ